MEPSTTEDLGGVAIRACCPARCAGQQDRFSQPACGTGIGDETCNIMNSGASLERGHHSTQPRLSRPEGDTVTPPFYILICNSNFDQNYMQLCDGLSEWDPAFGMGVGSMSPACAPPANLMTPWLPWTPKAKQIALGTFRSARQVIRLWVYECGSKGLLR